MRLLLSAAILSGAFTSLIAAMAGSEKIHWSSKGSGKTTIIFVHGWTCDESSWQAQVPALEEKYRVITLDLPGHGQTAPPNGGKFSMDVFARAVEAVRMDAKADNVVLVGHSMGAPVIRQYARLYPQHVAALVLVDGVVRKPQASPAAAPPTAQFDGKDGMANRERMIRGMFTPNTPPAVQQEVLKMMLTPPGPTANAAMDTMSDPSIWKDDVISVPVLGLYADHSRLGNQEYLKQIYPALEYVEIPGTGHFLMLEKPEEFNRLLLSFLEKHHF